MYKYNTNITCCRYVKVLYITVIALFLSQNTYAQTRTEFTKESKRLYDQGVKLYNEKRYVEAIPVFAKCDSIDKLTIDSIGNRSDYAAMWLASCYYKLGDTNSADKFSSSTNYKVKPIDRRVTEKSDILCQEAEMYVSQKDYNKAIKLYTKASEIEKQKLGKCHWYANTIEELAECYLDIQDTIMARLKFDEYIQIYTNIYGNTIELANAYCVVAQAYSSRMDTQVYPVYLSKSKSICADIEQSVNISPLYSRIVILEINKLLSEQKSKEALGILERNKRHFKSEEEQLLYDVFSGSLNFQSGFPYSSVAPLTRVTEYCDEHFNECIASNNMMILNSYFTLALCGKQIGKDAGFVLENLFKAHKVYKSLNRMDSADYTAMKDFILSELTNTQIEDVSLSSECQSFLQDIAGLNEGKDVQNVWEYAILAKKCKENKDYRGAIKNQEKAWDIIKFRNDVSESDKIAVLNNLASYEYDIANYKRCVVLNKDILRRIGTQSSCAQDGLAAIYLYLGSSEERLSHIVNSYEGTELLDSAEKHILLAYDLLKQQSPQSDMFVQTELERINILLLKGNVDEVQRLINLVNYKNLDNPNCLRFLQLSHAVYMLQGDIDKCIALSDIYDEVSKNYIDEKTSISDKITKAYLYSLKKDYERVKSIFRKEDYQRLNTIYLTDMSFMLDVEQEQYLSENDVSNLIYQIAANTPIKEIVEIGYDNALFRKSILLDWQNGVARNIRYTKNPQIKNLYKDISKLSKDIVDSNNQSGMADSQILQDSLYKMKRYLVDLLVKENMEINIPKWKDVYEALTDDDIAIEFVQFFSYNEKKMKTGVFILDKQYDSPRFLLLGDNGTIRDDDYFYDDYIGWMKDYLKDKKNIYYSPAGSLLGLTLGTLPSEDGTCLEDNYNVYRLTSTKVLADRKDKLKRTSPKSVALFGGLSYNSIISNNNSEIFENKYKINMRDYRDVATYLPESLNEVNNISELLSDASVKNYKYTEDKGTEVSFKTLVKSKKIDILHIATHGLYWTEEEANKKTNMQFIDVSKNFMTTNENKSLSRSALLFAGANNTLEGKKHPNTENDGVLTSQEIVQMDLSGIDLVVLSACKTGIGDISTEGFLGLERAFKRVGVNSILMTLWKVDDLATRLIMEEFYKNYLSGKSKIESLRNAQKFVKNYTIDGEKPYISGNYWAAFMLVDALD